MSRLSANTNKKVIRDFFSLPALSRSCSHEWAMSSANNMWRALVRRPELAGVTPGPRSRPLPTVPWGWPPVTQIQKQNLFLFFLGESQLGDHRPVEQRDLTLKGCLHFCFACCMTVHKYHPESINYGEYPTKIVVDGNYPFIWLPHIMLIKFEKERIVYRNKNGLINPLPRKENI